MDALDMIVDVLYAEHWQNDGCNPEWTGHRDRNFDGMGMTGEHGQRALANRP